MTETCARMAIKTILYQYKEENPTTAIPYENVEMPKNKALDMITACPVFGEYLMSLDKKERRYTTAICNIKEFKPEERIITKDSPVDSVIIILKGEVMEFNDNGFGKPIKPGTILGFKDMLYSCCWKYNTLGRTGGYLIHIK